MTDTDALHFYVNAAKELTKENERLRAEVERLQARVEQLQDGNAFLAARLGELRTQARAAAPTPTEGT